MHRTEISLCGHQSLKNGHWDNKGVFVTEKWMSIQTNKTLQLNTQVECHMMYDDIIQCQSITILSNWERHQAGQCTCTDTFRYFPLTTVLSFILKLKKYCIYTRSNGSLFNLAYRQVECHMMYDDIIQCQSITILSNWERHQAGQCTCTDTYRYLPLTTVLSFILKLKKYCIYTRSNSSLFNLAYLQVKTKWQRA